MTIATTLANVTRANVTRAKVRLAKARPTQRIGAAAALVLAGCGVAAAMPVASLTTASPIVLVRDGCGPGFHRGPGEGCVPNGGRAFVEPRVIGPREVAPVRLPPPCPRGYFRDPDPARPLCYPRF